MRLILFTLAIFYSTVVNAGKADVVDVSYKCKKTCSFSVTVVHADDGWDHYADRWEVLTLSGDVIATRVLAHPHGKNKPFTRSLSGIDIPEEVSTVVVRAHDLIHGYGGKEITVEWGQQGSR
jgi:hypothetical protein